ncbi:hypothetical protein FC52_GL001515 [Lactobacillus pasteurii DSM 23907 = CRBIP 24.76]|nr:hypothetical protein FC52_GL001515 [Lactobacillus pasteurii DSM 23907 = CRBIP 24.76]
MQQGDLKTFNKLVNDPAIKKTVSAYTRLSLTFNAAIAENHIEAADKVFDEIASLNLTSEQKLSFFGNALNYYIGLKNKPKAKICYDKVKSARRNEAQKDYLMTIYEVMVEDQTSKKKLIEQRLNHEANEQKLADYYLLEHIYQVEGDLYKAKECSQLAQKLAKQL